MPWLSGTSNTIYPWIFVPGDVYEDLQSDHPQIASRATLIHEEVHLRRQKEPGIVWFGLKYLLSRSFRYREELLAIGEQMKFVRSEGGPFDIDRRGRMLAGWVYLWCVPFERARSDLLKMWEEL